VQEGDRIGLVRRSSGALHYFINNVDQGVASPCSPQTVWGVVDLYGMAVQVTVIDVSDDGSRLCPDNNIVTDSTRLQLTDNLSETCLCFITHRSRYCYSAS